MTARYLTAERRPGARIVTSKSWESEGRLRVYLHFDRPVSPNTELRILLRIEWPRYAADILDGRTEIVHWTARRPALRITSTYRFDKAFSRKPLTVTPLTGTVEPDVEKTESNGATKIHLDLQEIEVDQEYGYRVGLAD